MYIDDTQRMAPFKKIMYVFIYLKDGTVQTFRHKNSVREKIKSRFKSGNACYHSMQNLLFSSLLPQNIKIKRYGTVILSVVFLWV